jgi:hypothetical protein
MSHLPPLGHFNFARIGHYYFALTQKTANLRFGMNVLYF